MEGQEEDGFLQILKKSIEAMAVFVTAMLGHLHVWSLAENCWIAPQKTFKIYTICRNLEKTKAFNVTFPVFKFQPLPNFQCVLMPPCTLIRREIVSFRNMSRLEFQVCMELQPVLVVQETLARTDAYMHYMLATYQLDTRYLHDTSIPGSIPGIIIPTIPHKQGAWG